MNTESNKGRWLCIVDLTKLQACTLSIQNKHYKINDIIDSRYWNTTIVTVYVNYYYLYQSMANIFYIWTDFLNRISIWQPKKQPCNLKTEYNSAFYSCHGDKNPLPLVNKAVSPAVANTCYWQWHNSQVNSCACRQFMILSYRHKMEV